MGEQEGEEESTVVAIVTGAKRNARSNEKSGVRIGLTYSLQAYITQNSSAIKSMLAHGGRLCTYFIKQCKFVSAVISENILYRACQHSGLG